MRPLNTYAALDRMRFKDAADQPEQIVDGIYYFSRIKRYAGNPVPLNVNLVMSRNGPTSTHGGPLTAADFGDLADDDFGHESALAIRHAGKLFVLSACSHNGIVNIVDTVLEMIPGTPIRALWGGFHLIDPITQMPFMEEKLAETPETVDRIATLLSQRPIEKIYTGHCTGTKEGYSRLKAILGDKLEYFATGCVYTF
jgi:metal-dependent hydrolase (beta-lactamase superfamily II)